MPYDRPIYDFNEKMDLDPINYKAWVLGTQWYPPPWCPLYMDLHFCYGTYGMQYGPEIISDPRTRGWDARIYKGALYFTVIPTTDEEKKEREPVWREKMRGILEEPWALWEKGKAELSDRFDQFLDIELEMLGDIELCDHFIETWHYYKRVQELHFYPMYALGSGNILFRRLLKQILDISPEDVEYAQLHSGFDNEMTMLAERLAEVSAAASTLGLDGIIKYSKPEEVLSNVEGAKNGKQWIQKFNEMVKQYGWIRRRFLEMNTPCWWEDNTLAIVEVQRYVTEGKKTARTVESRPQLEERRQKLEQDLLGRVPTGKLEGFKKLMRCSQASHIFSEEHTVYAEGLGVTVIRLAVMELGRRFANKGIIDMPEDVFFLNHEEILHAGIIQQRCDLRSFVERRKREYDGYRKYEGTLPLFLGDPTKIPDLIDADVVFSVNVAPPIAKPEEVGASLVGCAGAPGVVEGIAFVAKGEEDMDKVEPGTILVVPATTPGWTPIFNVIKGVITDGGGYLTHALIVSREFGIPAVVGTQEATKMIKTGQRVKVDGNLCRVYIIN